MYPLPEILERVERRRRAWTVIETDLLPPPEVTGETCICGTLSLCTLQTKKRYIIADACIVTDAGKETPTSLARDYLTVVYKKSPMVTHKQILYLREHTAPLPLYAEPCTFRAGYYLDIVSTYLTLMRLYGWNVDYWPGKWLAVGRPPFDFPWPENRLARNSLVSAGMSQTVQIYKPGAGYMTLKTGNHLANLQLYCLIADTLCAVAAEMVSQAGAVYVNTDGYILPNHASLTKAIDILTAWHLPPHVKNSGAGMVKGTAAYKFGDGVPKRHLLGPKPIDKITPLPSAAWLKIRAGEIAQRRANEA